MIPMAREYDPSEAPEDALPIVRVVLVLMLIGFALDIGDALVHEWIPAVVRELHVWGVW
jgi:hypothetical protein